MPRKKKVVFAQAQEKSTFETPSFDAEVMIVKQTFNSEGWAIKSNEKYVRIFVSNQQNRTVAQIFPRKKGVNLVLFKEVFDNVELPEKYRESADHIVNKQYDYYMIKGIPYADAPAIFKKVASFKGYKLKQNGEVKVLAQSTIERKKKSAQNGEYKQVKATNKPKRKKAEKSVAETPKAPKEEKPEGTLEIKVPVIDLDELVPAFK